MLHHYCDYCHNRIDDPNEEVPITMLKLPCGDIFFFCGEDCLWDFINEYSTWGYLLPSGAIEEEE